MRLVVIALLCFVIATTSALSHSWYDYDCCSDNDCGPVVDARQIPNVDPTRPPQLQVTIRIKGKEYTAVKPDDFPVSKIRESKDGLLHACISPFYPHGLLCLYMPPGQ